MEILEEKKEHNEHIHLCPCMWKIEIDSNVMCLRAFFALHTCVSSPVSGNHTGAV